jgi:uncharacterized Zn finger protein (UPF0148 family)
MRIRGERECSDCGQRWSYYETGSVSCPACGSLRSTGVGEREQHTADPIELDLTRARELAGEDRWEEAIDEAVERCGEYVRRQGFVCGGELLAFDDTYLAAAELRAVARASERRPGIGLGSGATGVGVGPEAGSGTETKTGSSIGADDAEEIYLLALLRGADIGERPSTDVVPAIDAVRAARALAYASAVREYRREASAYLDDHPDPTATTVLGSIAEHTKRVQALDGNADVGTVETLVAATKDVGRAIRENEEGALATARDRLDRLSVL